jgi:hypothetical protein
MHRLRSAAQKVGVASQKSAFFGVRGKGMTSRMLAMPVA